MKLQPDCKLRQGLFNLWKLMEIHLIFFMIAPGHNRKCGNYKKEDKRGPRPEPHDDCLGIHSF